MGDVWPDKELIAAGWGAPDIEFEHLIEQAIADLTTQDTDACQKNCGQALFVARESFSDDDPRLATALNNYAAMLTLRGDKTAETLQAEAEKIWHNCDSWLAQLTAPRVARSSLFHMRMEQRHREEYEQRWHTKWRELATEAQAKFTTAFTLNTIDVEAISQRWQRERPAMLNDTRKLMVAVYLLLR